MKYVDICENCYAHLVESRVYLYVENEFTEMLHLDGIETEEDPTPLIHREIELSSRPSLYTCTGLVS
ncbi:MAG: hypothetical protein U9Q40_00290 [Campylobacterota bacterium]|nr:hypothetical protein [Campylobacterota bacterium]